MNKNLSQHPFFNKQSEYQLLKWDHYYRGHEGLWTSNWRKLSSREPGTEETCVVLSMYIPLLPFITNPDQMEMKSSIGPFVLCIFT